MALTVSIIIPAYNEQEYIQQCLNSIKEFQHLIDSDLEVIVVNNGSTDNTLEQLMLQEK